ncbi:arginine--tRNA ligase [Cucumibacter marinus]|uniref:arginine--tRNA ligase n=1 Tax=Cucumibacter marinus TaxID=1121252 RepID=UPI0004029E69|nr:arginine--tRNA ligase [Cucumibacter marinus]
MDVFAVFHERVAQALLAAYPALSEMDDLRARFTVEPPRDPSHGDLSTNAAMVVGKPLKTNPREIAGTLAEHFANDGDVEACEVAGPGFLNFRLTPALFQTVVAAANRLGTDFGRSTAGEGIGVNVEYVSANPTGPLHVGHTRGAVYGDALASLMAFSGFEVTREYYINDAGGQVDVLARSAYLRYREALGEDIGAIPEGLYPGDYLKPVGEALKAKYGSDLAQKAESEWLPIVKPFALDMMMDLVRSDLARLSIHHDVFFSERTLHGDEGDIAKTLAWLKEQGLVYVGKLEPPKGKLPEDWEDRDQTLFRASDFGDDTDRALVKSDGSYTYFAADIAYHRNKYLRGFTQQVIVLGADHAGYIKRLKAALKAVSGGEAEIDVRICQLVNLTRGGEPVKMSKRAGTMVNLSDVVDEVGPDAVRFIMLFRRNDAPLDFDFDAVTAQTRDNPVFYVQYAHARACSIFRTAERDLPALDTSADAIAAADLSVLDSPEDMTLIHALAQFPRTVEGAARAHEPHRIAFYLYDLASAFHTFWAKGKENPRLRFVNDDDQTLTLARLALVAAVRQVLKTGLTILGVTAPEELS